MEQEKNLKDIKIWMSSLDPDFVEFLGRLLSSLPDGDNPYFDPLIDGGFGWLEIRLIEKLLSAINDGGDVRVALRYLFQV